MTEEQKSQQFNVSVRQCKTGALIAEVTLNGVPVKEIWQDFVLNPKVTHHMLRKQVELEVWTDKI